MIPEATAAHSTRIRVKGRNVSVRGIDLEGRRVVVRGHFARIAQVVNEELVEGEVVRDPAEFIEQLRRGLRADIFIFPQRPPDVSPKFQFRLEWDNWAIADTTTFDSWWKALPQESRRNVRIAAKKGVVTKVVPFDTQLVQGIHAIYNETPVRQGKKFWHYGKDLATVHRELGDYLTRSEFTGAFLGDELIGFCKIIYVNGMAVLVQILTKVEHNQKRTMNALLAHAVQLCEQKGVSSLVYGNYVYGRKNDSSLTELKRRNGFSRVDFPRYFVPLSARGKLLIALGLHLGLENIIPRPVSGLLLKCRARLASAFVSRPAPAALT